MEKQPLRVRNEIEETEGGDTYKVIWVFCECEKCGRSSRLHFHRNDHLVENGWLWDETRPEDVIDSVVQFPEGVRSRLKSRLPELFGLSEAA